MKKFSKLFAIITMIALLLTSLMPVSVFANPLNTETNGVITITSPPSQSVKGWIFNAYKIFDLDIVDSATDGYAYTLTDEFKDFEGAGYLGTITQDTTLAEYLRSLESDSDEMTALSKLLWEYIIDKNIHPTCTPVVGDEDGAEFTDLPYGYYLIYATYENSDVTVVASCSLTTAEPEAKIALKGDVPTLNKEIYNDNIVGEDEIGWIDWADLNIGDTAKFRLLTKVPVTTGYDTYTFTVYDQMSKGLTFQNDVKVVIDGLTSNPIENNDFTTSPVAADGSFTITFDPEYFVSDELRALAGNNITITYSAVVNEFAKVDGHNDDPEDGTSDPNPNTAYLEFSNNPYWDIEGKEKPTDETPKTEVDVYTFKIDIFKYTGNNLPLPGAGFSLTKKGESDPIRFVNMGNGLYRVAKSDDETGTTIIVSVSTDNKNIEVIGLDAGIYTLEETQIPEGYNPIDPIEVTITHSDTDESAEGRYTVTPNDENGVIRVENRAGTLFPGTGGIGRTIFILVGSTMLAVGLISLVVFRKKIFGTK